MYFVVILLITETCMSDYSLWTGHFVNLNQPHSLVEDFSLNPFLSTINLPQKALFLYPYCCLGLFENFTLNFILDGLLW